MNFLRFQRNPTDSHKRQKHNGDIVRYWFDTGGGRLGGFQIIWGRVVRASDKTYDVIWESGRRNRIRQDKEDVTLEVDPEMLEEAKKLLARRLGST
jgi:hypothetical protein